MSIWCKLAGITLRHYALVDMGRLRTGSNPPYPPLALSLTPSCPSPSPACRGRPSSAAGPAPTPNSIINEVLRSHHYDLHNLFWRKIQTLTYLLRVWGRLPHRRGVQAPPRPGLRGAYDRHGLRRRPLG